MDSDTESESQAYVGGWDATEFAHIATTQALFSSQNESQDAEPSGADVEQAVRDLQSLDLEVVEKVCCRQGSAYLCLLTYGCRMKPYTVSSKSPRPQFSPI